MQQAGRQAGRHGASLGFVVDVFASFGLPATNVRQTVPANAHPHPTALVRLIVISEDLL